NTRLVRRPAPGSACSPEPSDSASVGLTASLGPATAASLLGFRPRFLPDGALFAGAAAAAAGAASPMNCPVMLLHCPAPTCTKIPFPLSRSEIEPSGLASTSLALTVIAPDGLRLRSTETVQEKRPCVVVSLVISCPLRFIERHGPVYAV